MICVLVSRPVRSVADLGAALTVAAFGPASGYPAPRNLDALADFLRETQFARVQVEHWALPAAPTRSVREVFADAGAHLLIP